MLKYKLVNKQDGNDEIELESTNKRDAIAEALDSLQWHVVEYEDDEIDYEYCEERCSTQKDCDRVSFADCPSHPSNKTGEKI